MRTMARLFLTAGFTLTLAGLLGLFGWVWLFFSSYSDVTVAVVSSLPAWYVLVGGLALLVGHWQLAKVLYLPWLWLFARLGGFRHYFGLAENGDGQEMVNVTLSWAANELEELYQRQTVLGGAAVVEGSWRHARQQGLSERANEFKRQLGVVQRRIRQARRRFYFLRDLAWASGRVVFLSYGRYTTKTMLLAEVAEVIAQVATPSRRAIASEWVKGGGISYTAVPRVSTPRNV